MLTKVLTVKSIHDMNIYLKPQIFRALKLSTLCLILGVEAGFATESYSQKTTFTISVQDQSVKEVFDYIEQHSEFIIFYLDETIDVNRKVSVNLKGQRVESILEQLFKNTDVTYTINDRQILLSKRKTEIKTIPVIAISQQQKNMVTGVVLDPHGMPVIGANILVKGTTNGTITDMDGKFSLDVDKDAILVVSYIGFASQEIKVGNQMNLSIALKEDSEALDELVVVGYGTQKKVNLTGSVEVLEGDKLENRPVTTVTQALQGQVSGANFTTGSFGYEPGASLSFQIRGQGDAYVLVDGVPTDLSRVNPNDIESISVLKDAAAASIYGAMASYGVVLITTKSGKSNQKPVISFNANVATKKLHRKPHMVDSWTFAKMLNEAGDNGGGRVYDNETIDRIIAYQNDPTLPETVPSTVVPGKWAEEQYSNANYDWFDEYYGSGLTNQENISIRGGSEKVKYYVSAGHVYDDGIINYGTDNYRRLNTIAKIDVELTKWWSFSVNNRFQHSKRVKPNFDNQGDYDLLFHQIARTFPNQAKVTPNGYYTKLSKIPWTQDAGTDETKGYETMQRFTTEIRPLTGWKINADYTFRSYTSKFTSNNFICYEDMVDGTLVPLGTTVPSYVEKNQQNNFYSSFNAYTSYQFDIKDMHNFSIMAGLQQEQQRNETLAGRKNDIVTNEVPSISTSTGDIHSLTDDLTHWSRLGFFFRLNYNFKEKYLLEVNGRYDGTSIFAEGNRWGFFPSFSGAWNISREAFFDPIVDKVNNLKVRASWGSLGNQNVTAYQDLALMGIKSNLAWLLNGSRPVYTTAPNLVNTMLTWETSQTLDFGIDAGFLNNRLNVTADWYQRHTKDRLGPAEALPAVIGATIPKKNNLELRTNGWEIAVTWRDQVNDDFSYSVSAMLYDYYSTVTKYNNPTNILTTDYEGKRVGDLWGYTTEGLIQTQEEADKIMQTGYQNQFHSVWNTGDVKYADLNKDGVVNNGKNTLEDHGDLSIIGNTTPRYQFSLTLGAEYKGFDFSMMWQGVGKRDLWINSNMFWGFTTWNQSSLFVDDHLDYYRDKDADTYAGLGINTESYFPRPYLVDNQNNKNRQTQTRYLQNGAYARLKNLQLGYTLPKSLTEKIELSRVRIYFSGDNLCTLTGRFPHSLDPETSTIGSRGHGKSMSAQTAFSFGIDVEF